MQFVIQREALLKPLQVVSGVVEKRQTLPVLANVLMTIKEGTLTLVGTDLEVELTASTEIENATEGEVTVPARKFMDICRTLPEGAEITVKVDGEKATIRSGKSRFSLSTLPAAEFPATEEVKGAFEFAITQKALKGLIERTQFCMANQDVRYYLNGLLLDLETGRIRAVATDGHRLAISEEAADDMATENRQAIVPRKGVIELARLLEGSDETCVISMNANHMKVALGDIGFSTKLVDGRFPDYERVLPKETDKTVFVEKDLIKQALIRTSILSNEKYRGVRLQIEDNQLRATVNNPEQEEAEEEIDVVLDGDGVEIGFNVGYLLDAINAVSEDNVEIQLSDPNSSCLITGKDNEKTRYVVMPMRL